jgi:hypothetical protein
MLRRERERGERGVEGGGRGRGRGRGMLISTNQQNVEGERREARGRGEARGRNVIN